MVWFSTDYKLDAGVVAWSNKENKGGCRQMERQGNGKGS